MQVISAKLKDYKEDRGDSYPDPFVDVVDIKDEEGRTGKVWSAVVIHQGKIQVVPIDDLECCQIRGA